MSVTYRVPHPTTPGVFVTRTSRRQNAQQFHFVVTYGPDARWATFSARRDLAQQAVRSNGGTGVITPILPEHVTIKITR